MSVEPLEPRQLLAANPLITEFMANNNDNLGLGEVERDFGKADPFGDGSEPDWIEIFNAGDEAIDLEGYYLTDRVDELTQWSFPSFVLEPGEHRLVFATGMTGVESTEFVDAEGRVHTNFGLGANGENLALVAPDGTTILSQFQADGRDYPDQISDVSYGYIQTASLITPRSEAYYWVPLGGDLGTRWTEVDFDVQASGVFTAGTASMGFEDRPNDRTNFVGHFDTEIPSGSHALFARMEFDVTNAADSASLLLRMKYDNGFVAFLNGQEVWRENAPDNAGWFNTAPSGSRRDSQGRTFADFDLSEHSGLLQDGKNVLAVHLLNNLSDNSDMLLAVELYSDKPVSDSNLGYLVSPTPGAANIVFDALAGPLIRNLTENPGALADDQDLLVTAIVREHNAPIDEVSLYYRVNFDDELSMPMVDDGTGGDRTAGDGIYSATIPASVSAPGEMVRWRVETFDVQGNAMRWPLFADPLDSDRYLGTIVEDPSVVSNLPVFYWFLAEGDERRAETAGGARGSIFYEGQFYDNARADIHGQSSSGFPKKSFDIDFSEGNRFRWKRGEDRVRDINLLTTWADKGNFRNALAYEMHREGGDPALFAFSVRVQRNGEFFSVADMVEDADDRTLERWGLNPQGALYKMYTTFTGVREEKKSRKWENQSDLQELHDRTRLRGEEWNIYAHDNINLAAFANFQALQDVTSNHDCCHKNYYFYRDTGQTNEWRPVIWDVDLTFGHHWRSSVNYFEDRMSWDNSLEQGSNNTLIQKVWQVPGFQDMYFRRLRTLMDQFVQPVDTPYEDRYVERRLDELVALMDPNDDPFDSTPRPPEWPDSRHGTVQGTDDADLDYNKWGSWDHGNGSRLHAARGETMREHIQRVKDEFLDQRRNFLYGQTRIPEAQIGNPILNFGVIEAAPSSGNLAEQYVELINPNAEAVDISGWRLSEAVDYTFPGGTVIPSGFTLYVVADKVAFRARTEGPSGGQQLFITGGWQGELSTEGESLSLLGADGTAVRRTFVGDLGDPTPVQESLRITEVNYAPTPPNAGLGELDDGTPNAADAFEFVELQNTGNQTLDLAGVALGAGVEFTFPAGATVEAGDFILVVKDQAAFESRYGTGLNVAGEYVGTLADSGDAVFLDDAGDRPIPGQAFAYRSSGDWPARAAAKGSSLQVVNTSSSYDDVANWEPSSEFGGSPGRAGAAAPTLAVISEISPNGVAPEGDAIELFNATYRELDISGWLLSNSDEDYFKFQVPNGTIIPARSYHVFSQSQLGFDLNSSQGDNVWLIPSDDQGRPTWFMDHASFGAVASGVTVGPLTGGDPTQPIIEGLVPLAEATLGGPNADRAIGEVIISEVQYDPMDADGGGRLRPRDFEYIELYNPGEAPVNLANWRLIVSGEKDYELTMPADTVLGPGQPLVVVPFSKGDSSKINVFRFTYGVPSAVDITNGDPVLRRGFEMVDAAEREIRLEMPDAPPPQDPNFTPYIIVDSVRFTSETPWPADATQTNSLTRVTADAVGSMATSWIAAPSSAGAVAFAPRVVGDANADGQFDQRDITLVLQSGKYKTGEVAGWGDGDWTGDALFDENDIIAALQAGTYLQGPLAALASDVALAKRPVADAMDEVFAELGVL